MTVYRIYTIASAPEKSKPVLEALNRAFGRVPNVAGVMAESPVLLEAFFDLFQRVHAGSFTEAEIQILLLTNAVTNGCAWAVAFHSALALKEGVAPTDVQAIRERRAPGDRGHAALSALTRALIERRGRIDERDANAALAAGFGHARVLEVITVLAASAMTNYAGNIAKPPLEAAFQQHAWTLTPQVSETASSASHTDAHADKESRP
jgi:AhpD family alkylhydroperoxidase